MFFGEYAYFHAYFNVTAKTGIVNRRVWCVECSTHKECTLDASRLTDSVFAVRYYSRLGRCKVENNSTIIDIIPENPDQRCIDLAVDELENGGIICYPTDTVYGLGASIRNKSAIEKISRIKRISNHKLLSFICKDLKDIACYAHVSNPAYKIMRRCLPGPFTFILPATSETPKLLSQKRRTVGIRIPDSLLCQIMVDQLGTPILSTSVPAGPDEILNDPYEIDRRIGDKLDLVLNGGILVSEPSTVVDLTNYAPHIVRKGAGDPGLIY